VKKQRLLRVEARERSNQNVHILQRRSSFRFWCELGDGVADNVPEIRDSACRPGAKRRLQLSEGALYRVEVRE
jgi:hypothetical protein